MLSYLLAIWLVFLIFLDDMLRYSSDFNQGLEIFEVDSSFGFI